MDTQDKSTETIENKQNTTFKKSIDKYFTQRNIIITICILFLFWMLFFDRNSVIKHFQLTKEQEKLIETKKTYQKRIQDTQKEINALNDDEYIEQIAREKHLMKKDNEDIYMVTD